MSKIYERCARGLFRRGCAPPFKLSRSALHSLCQGTNVLESPECCVEIFLFAEHSVQYRHARRLF